jgi:acyl-CoA thioester hydrolase
VKPADWSVRVYYEDTDAGGVVYHASYLRYLERARTEWLRTLGFSQARLKQEESLVFTVVGMTLDFAKPARLDDMLLVRSSVRLSGGASVEFSQEILRDEQRLLGAEVRVACLDARTFRPRRLPPAVRECLE